MQASANKSTTRAIFAIILTSVCAASAIAEPGITPTKIIIGQSAAFTGGPAEEVKQATAGANVYFDRVNSSGGVWGRKIALESLDDGFDPKRAVENTKTLLSEKNAFALFLYRGTPTTEAVLPILSDTKVPLIAPVTGATSLHEPVSRYVFNLRSKYRDEVNVAVRQLSSMGLRKLAVVASNDSFGKDALAGMAAAVKEYKLQDPTVALYERNTTKVDEAVQTIFSSDPQAVLMFCTAKSCEAFIRAYRKKGGFQPLFTLSNVSSKAFIESLGDHSRGLGMTQVFPNPKNTTVPIIKEFREAMKERPELADSYPALEGFIAAKVLVEGLRKSGAKPTRELFISSMEAFIETDFGGLALSYSQTNRSGSNFVELTVVGRNGVIMR